MNEYLVVLSANTSWYLYNFRRTTIISLQKLGYTVCCVSPYDGYSERLVQEFSVEWVDINIDNKGKNPFKDFKLIFDFFKIYNKLKPLVVCHFTIKNNIYGTFPAFVLGAKVINNVTGLGTAFISGGLVSSFVKLLYRFTQPFAHKVFCQNQDDYDFLVAQKLVRSKKLELLPGSGVDINRFSPGVRAGVSKKEKFVFLFVGRMIVDKGVTELLEAAELLSKSRNDFLIKLCGFTSVDNVSALSESYIKKWAKKDYIDWLGPSDHIEEIYSMADCVILPSYREGMPRTLLEAGAMGIPSITTNVPGCRHLINDGFNGFVCEVKDPADLMRAMIKMLNLDESEYSSICANARDFIVSHYCDSLVVNKTIKAIESA
ncbi:glycosyltransferase family 4 protein [Vibrio crassostreae]|uniref:glycosyltransferase family 4 protein n=1 Tax=Vibrio crassostreae TaxID=246167 RepID=UPI00104A4BA6|nr:glycosyltransferase family 4 protein [Vibrio crassostreae]TCW16952.1 glycosyltransferase involved in cell wall biosynthesis [Vibrio crassostreae]CAK3667526.1 galacturonosyltransferase WbtD [Vibrio crassostreae]